MPDPYEPPGAPAPRGIWKILREIDIPPLWFGVFALAAWATARIWSVPATGLRLVGAVALCAGVGLFAAALLQMRQLRTTVVPRRQPAALASRGVFALSRNPIYLADALILLGLICWWGALAALPLVPLFMVLITRRYILAEEAGLRAQFGAQYEAYCRRTRRWI